MPRSAREPLPHYLYIILCHDGSLYTGITKNLEKRIRQHTNGKGARYTRTHTPQKLIYVDEFNSRAEAMKKERKIKRLTHKQKLKLINSQPLRRRMKKRRLR